MEKLLNLLKQYWRRTFNDETLLRIYYEEKTDCFCWMYQPRPAMKLEQGQMLETPVVFSKKFGFIKWLIENNKMDKEKIIMAETLPITDINEDYLLMLLAIQDDPIATLSFMLK